MEATVLPTTETSVKSETEAIILATGNGVRLQLNSSEHQAITDLPPPPHLATGSTETKQLQSNPSYDVIPAAAGIHGHAGAAKLLELLKMQLTIQNVPITITIRKPQRQQL
ncbi:hypothetical protein WN944_005649 [Citrus x changshan-huyou]|uniref:Uncharacterized protein n=1 Tax=Citrus x changshan-huyou TaxID=2935761 RepID=A0AAP0MHR7_9ROSI